jgi:hypothetical protein
MEPDRLLLLTQISPFFPALRPVKSDHATKADLSILPSEARFHFTFVISFQMFSVCTRHFEVLRKLIGY